MLATNKQKCLGSGPIKATTLNEILSNESSERKNSAIIRLICVSRINIFIA